MKTLIKNVWIINEGKKLYGDVLLNNNIIERVCYDGIEADGARVIDGKGGWLLPGVIDDQVHFREPGLTRKADIWSESRAALAGGVTSFMEMPNTNPQTTNRVELEAKFDRAAEVSAVNYSFYMGATNDNLDEVLAVDPKRVCGIKVFMGSSTGNMLVDSDEVLGEIFRGAPCLIATHCEDEATVQRNLGIYKEHYGDGIPIEAHCEIRSSEACYRSSSKAVELATKFGTRLHVLHLSTEREMGLFSSGNVEDKLITSEVCVHHLWFNSDDYKRYGTRIKWNPAVKSESDRAALVEALNSDVLDVVATDHAPHGLDEKMNNYMGAPSGGPLVQHSLVGMIEMSRRGYFSIEKVVEKMCHAPATLFEIEKRGFIREGYYADLVLVNPQFEWCVSKENILYKCGWSPFEGEQFGAKVTHTFINGVLAYENGKIDDTVRGERLIFGR